MKSTTTLILMLYLIQGSLGNALPQSSIVENKGSSSVNIENAPYMAALLYIYPDTMYRSYRNYTTLWCAGSIIHKQFVLTTATCSEYNPVLVRVGSSHYKEGGKLYQVEKYIKHERKGRNDNDVALLKLTEPVTFGPSVAVIKLADDSVSITVGLTANVTGWGPTITELQQVPVTVLPSDECDKSFGLYKLTDKQICVNNEYKGTCNYDIGGPLTVGDVQIGVVAYGSICTEFPTVYEKVAPHLQWIEDTINENL